MTIQDDIEALEKALEAFKPTPYGVGSNADGWDAFEEACSPDRIRRLLDARKACERSYVDHLRVANEQVEYEAAEGDQCKAKLSKAIELLEKWNAAYEADIGDASEYRAAWSGARAFLKDCKP